MKDKNICKDLNFQDCELAILRAAVDKAEIKQGEKTANSEEIKKMITIVENFIKLKKLICYGGTAINNILPKKDQFYNKDLEIPDYDFFSHNALNDTKELCNIFANNGFEEVEGKSGQHHGTYKVFVNFIPIADITYIPKELFMALKKESIRVAGILYPPANYLRMSMYLELSRPAGDISRWEKVLKRLSLLNKNYPLVSDHCENIDFQRNMENMEQSELIYNNVRNTLIDQGVVFFGGYALSKYSKYMPFKFQKNIKQIPDFDVLTEEPKITAEIIKERLQDLKIKGVKIIRHDAVGEIISANYEIIVNEDTLCFIYEPLACHSYNIIKENGETIKIATIDTMLSFYLAFLYANRKYYHKERILCMSTYLFDVQQRNRLEQKGLLKRFSLNCIGHQESVEEMRADKAAKYKELKNNKDHPEYEEYFLRYRPNDIPNKDKDKNNHNNKIQIIPNTTNKSNKANKNTTKTQRQNKKKRINKTKKHRKNTKDPFQFLKFKDV
jgi:predicted transcriptional regulator